MLTEHFKNLNEKDTIIIFGCSTFGNDMYATIERLLNRQAAFCDNSLEKQGHFGDKTIYSPEEAAKKFPDGHYIPSVYDREIREKMTAQLLELGIARENIYDFFAENKLRKTMISFEIDLATHCNLNCKYCSHFSPLSKENYVSKESFQRDFERISELFCKQASRVSLLGGEPLLNKDVSDYLHIARMNFPEAKIELVTNGIILPKMPDAFWQACAENNIAIRVSRYPVKLDVEKIKDQANRFHVRVEIEEVAKKMRCFPLDLEGKQNPEINFYKCELGNGCINLKEGRMYTCSTIPNINSFNSYFGTNLEVCEDDSIDIYQVKDGEEILDFLNRPALFCRYCDVDGITDGHDWAVTGKNIKEWTI